MDKLAKYRKVFVKASNDGEGVSYETKQTSRERHLKGEDVKQFYDELIAEDSNEQSAANFCAVRQTENLNQLADQVSEAPPSVQVEKFSIRTLFRAAQNNECDILRTHFENSECNDADPNIRDEFGWTLLMTASCANSLECVEYLLSRRADTTVFDKAGNTALSLAFKKGHGKVIDLFERLDSIVRVKSEPDNEEDSVDDVTVMHQPFYCLDCEQEIVNTDPKAHKNSVAHQLHCAPPNVPTMYGISERNRGFQMMVNSGWDRDQGLGAQGQGKKFPVKTVLKRDRQGIGSKGAHVARVTHFAPGDVKSVEDVRQKNTGERVEREATLSKRRQEQQRRKEKRMEQRFRNELNGL